MLLKCVPSPTLGWYAISWWINLNYYKMIISSTVLLREIPLREGRRAQVLSLRFSLDFVCFDLGASRPESQALSIARPLTTTLDSLVSSFILGSWINILTTVFPPYLCYLRILIFLGSTGKPVTFKNRLIYFMSEYSIFTYTYMPEEGVKSHCRCLSATIWFLGVELKNSRRSASALNLWTTSIALPATFLLYPSLSTQFFESCCLYILLFVFQNLKTRAEDINHLAEYFSSM